MFPSRSFKGFPCPEFPQCSRSYCHYSHQLCHLGLIKRDENNGGRSYSKRSLSETQVSCGLGKRSRPEGVPHPQNDRLEREPHLPLYAVPQNFSRVDSTSEQSTQRSQRVNADSLHEASIPVGGVAKPVPQNPPSTCSSSANDTLTTNYVSEPPPPVVTKSFKHPRVKLHGLSSKLPVDKRQRVVDLIHCEYKRIYKGLPNGLCEQLACEHAVQQEQRLHASSTRASYMSSAALLLTRLKRRKESTGESDVGLDGDYVEPSQIGSVQDRCNLYNWERKELDVCLTPQVILQQLGYTLRVPETRKTLSKVKPLTRECDRCGAEYKVKFPLADSEKRACTFHHGRAQMTKRMGKFVRVYQCCGTVVDPSEVSSASTGCQVGPHVFKVEATEELADIRTFVQTKAALPEVNSHTLLALDCEMCHTTAGLELTRFTIVDKAGNVTVDVLVAPTSPMVDLNTRFSGITAEMLGVDPSTGLATLPIPKSAKLKRVSFEEAQQLALRHISADTVIVGHGLENDLKVLGLCHERIIDTVYLFPHSKGLPYRMSLKRLAKDFLGKTIQTNAIGSNTVGHSSVEDAQTCLELLSRYRKNATRFQNDTGEPVQAV